MKIIGVTGGIGAGKSSVSSILKELGAEVIDADALTHQLEEIGAPAYVQIIKEFGSHILNDNQTLNRKRLADVVFHQPELKKKLEEIVHSEVVKSMLDRLSGLRNRGYQGMVVLDVPIPVKHGFLDIADEVWVVTADDGVRIKRVMERSGLTLDEAKSRIISQMSQEEYMRLADVIIKNDGSLDELRKRVTSIVK